jgi:NAD(P)-dependent dehydrogenase (short-subunit alcohol dehydrogenase family)
MRLEQCSCLVTGAASGLGWAVVQGLHAHGANVALLDANRERVQACARKLGERATAYVADVRDAEQVAAAIEQVKMHLGVLRGVVNCAGVAPAQKIVAKGAAHELDLWQRVLDINLTGTFNVVRLVAAEMIGNSPDPETGERGVIINTASIAAIEGQRGQVAYAASKAGVIGMSLPIARDLAEYAVRCVAIAPGVFDTAMLEGIPEKAREALSHTAIFPNRMGRPQEFAALVNHVIENPFINGTCFRLDGAARLA